MKTQLANKLAPVLAALLFGAALLLLHHQLRGYDYRDVVRSLEATADIRVLAAVLLTLGSYTILTGYDVLALRYIGRPLPYPVAAMGSFVGYAFSNNGGFPLVTGGSVRYRMYSAWGLTALDVAKVMVFSIATFWLGFLSLGAISFLTAPLPVPASLPLPFESVRPLGILSLAVVAAYIGLCVVRRAPVRVRGWELHLPSPRFAIGQTVLATADLLMAAGVLYALLPAEADVPYATFVGMYVLGVVAGLISQVPGGLGVFETVILLLLGPEVSGAAVIGSLLAYRAVYFLLPLMGAGAVLAAHEAYRKRQLFAWVGRTAAPWVPLVAPQVLAVSAYVGGVILMFSAATPPARHRFGWLAGTAPLPAIELWHFLSGVAGAGLLLAARGLQERLGAGYFAAASLLALGIATSLLKGLDYVEAVLLTGILAALLPSRAYFYRRAPLLRTRFTPAWAATLAGTWVAVLWILSFAYRHVPYDESMWWRMHVLAHESRSLRAVAGAGAVLLLFALAKSLRRSAPPQPVFPAGPALDRALRVAAASGDSSANLVLQGNKLLLFNDSGNAFVMYGVYGRTWAALGDPVGPDAEKGELTWRFRELCDRYSGWPVFYEADERWLPIYQDVGLVPLRLSEEARVPLKAFAPGAALREAVDRVEASGVRFHVVPAADAPAWVPRFRAVMDRWLAAGRVSGRRFSVATFREGYAHRLPHAVAERDGEVLAFGSILPGAGHEELAVDPVRCVPGAPDGLLDYLLVRTAQWGAAEGYRWLSLGTTPLPAPEGQALAPLWMQLGALAYRHGEHFESPRDLRRFKERFQPEWRPKYLATPGGLVVPRVIENVAGLISGAAPMRRK